MPLGLLITSCVQTTRRIADSMNITTLQLQNKRAEYVSTLQSLQENVIALQGAIQAVDELIELSKPDTMTEQELVEAIERGNNEP